MANSSIDHRLAKVYQSGSQDELDSIYRDWAETYEDDLIAAGYSHPLVCLPLITRYLPAGPDPLLDAGCGTGLLGPWLQQLGYSHVAGFDASEEMLAIAREKQVYASLSQAFLGPRLPFSQDQFAAAVCMGVFTCGHVGAHGLDDLLRVIEPDGVLIFTVNEAMFDDAGFRQRIERFVSAGQCTQIDHVGPYLPTPGESSDDPTYCRAIVLQAH